MKFLLIIHADEQDWLRLSDEQQKLTRADHAELRRALRDQDKLLACQRLRPEAKTVRYQPDAGRFVTDGPFAETKETVGGFYLIECDSLDEALEWAKRIPRASHAAVEVREVWEDLLAS